MNFPRSLACLDSIGYIHNIYKGLVMKISSLLSNQWHPTRNEPLKAIAVGPSSHKKIWWKCRRGHEWQAMVHNRSRGSGCPVCASKVPTRENCLSSTAPQLVDEWHPRNEKKPEEFLPMSGAKVWWKCRFGHEWVARIANRSRGSGCPNCHRRKDTVGTNLALSFPELVEEWHLKNIGRPEDFFSESKEQVQWVCKKAHVYYEQIKHRASGKGCPFCSGERTAPVKNLKPKK